jgi:hypothetical protein
LQYSLHFPLWFGLLKIKTAKRLRKEERAGRVPVWRLGTLCFVWIAAGTKIGFDRPPPGTYFMRAKAAEASNPDKSKRNFTAELDPPESEQQSTTVAPKQGDPPSSATPT